MRRIQSGSSSGTNPYRAPSSERHSQTQQGSSVNSQSTSDNASIHASMIKEDPDGFLIVDQDIYRRLSEGGSSRGAAEADRIPSPPRDYSGVRQVDQNTWVGEIRVPEQNQRIKVGSFSTKKLAAEAVAKEKTERGMPLNRPRPF